MSSHAIEIILSRQWAEYLCIPVFIVDPDGNMLYYNTPAEKLLGRSFEERGPVPVETWSQTFKPKDAEGRDLPPWELPLVQTLQNREPAHGNFFIESLTGDIHHLSVTSIPIISLSLRFLGAIALFWKIDEG